MHLNPAVRETARGILGDCAGVRLIEPLDVEDMHNLMSRSFLVMTDSGGLQEEAPLAVFLFWCCAQRQNVRKLLKREQ